jgi:hypothetical protein
MQTLPRILFSQKVCVTKRLLARVTDFLSLHSQGWVAIGRHGLRAVTKNNIWMKHENLKQNELSVSSQSWILLDFIRGSLRVFRPPRERCFHPQAIKSILSVVEKRPNDTRYTHFPACVRTTIIYFRYFPNDTAAWRVMTLISRNAIFHVSRVASFALLMVLVDELRVKLF